MFTMGYFKNSELHAGFNISIENTYFSTSRKIFHSSDANKKFISH
jgi:hypothetical protein